MASGGGGSSKTQQTEPWDGAKPYLSSVYSEADRLYNDQPMTPWAGLGVDDRNAQAMQALGGDPTQLAAMYGLDPTQLQQSIVSGVAAPASATLQAQQQALGLAGQGTSPLFGQASGVVGDVLGGGGLQGQASDYYQNTLAGQTTPASELERMARGGYLGSNPQLDAMYQAASRPVIEQFRAEVLPGINSSFSSVGRNGSPAHQFAVGDRAVGALGRSLTDMSANLYGQNYENERNRQQAATSQLGNLYANAAGGLGQAGGQQMAAALSVPSLWQGERAAELGNLGLLGSVGAQQTGTAAQLAGAASQGYQGINMAPWQQLGVYSDLIGGMPSSAMSGLSGPGTSTNPMMGAAGGALGGAAMGSMFGPWGAAAGGIIGGGLGYFGS